MRKILELDIVLQESKPEIWRRVLVPDNMTFHELHYVIQFAMGWTNSHLYQFIVKKDDIYIGIPSEDDYFEIVVGDFSVAPKPPLRTALCN